MSNSNFIDQGVADYNQKFLDAIEFIDEVIMERQRQQMSVWRTMFERGSYTLGEGLVKKSFRFHAGLGDQRGLHRWNPIQLSRIAEGTDPGFDACAYNPHLVEYGFQTINYTGFQTERRTEHICIRDIRFTWQFRQQLGHIMSFLGDITASVWENYTREQYIKFAVDNGNGFVLSTGRPNQHTFTYDPFAVDTDNDNTLTYDATIPVSTLNWSYFRWFSRFLQQQVPMAAVGRENTGRNLYGMVFDLEDWDKMIEDDPDLREDFRHTSMAKEVLIDNFGTVSNYKGFALMHDPLAPRFSVKSATSTLVTLKREDPEVADEAITIGNKVNVSNAYLNAEFALGAILIQKVFKIEVPPAGPTNPGGGTSFGATPGLNGMFKWLNIPDQERNLLGENGFYFARFEAFAKPLMYDDEAIVFLYRRCPYTDTTECNIGGSDQGNVGENFPLASTPVAADLDTTNNTITLTLAAGSSSGATYLPCEPGDAVNLVNDNTAGETNIAGIVADATQAPTYTFALQASPGAAADWTHTDTGGALGGPYVECV